MSKKLDRPWAPRIVRDPKICHGEATFRGTRVLLRTILGGLAEGESAEDLIEAFPSLKPEDINAAIMFAFELAAREIRPPGIIEDDGA